MAQLNQIIALEGDAKSRQTSQLTEWHKLAQKNDVFNGFSRTYQKKDDESESYPDESKRVQHMVEELNQSVKSVMADFLQLTAKKEWTNAIAKADIVVDGKTVLADVPVTYLLFLEKQLTDIRTYVEKLPTLDPSYDWSKDENSGLWKSPVVQTNKQKTVKKGLVLYHATPEHPAQTHVVDDTIIVGYWNTQQLSGAIPVREKMALSEKVEKLRRAVKSAREAANSIQIVKVDNVGEKVLEYIFG